MRIVNDGQAAVNARWGIYCEPTRVRDANARAYFVLSFPACSWELAWLARVKMRAARGGLSFCGGEMSRDELPSHRPTRSPQRAGCRNSCARARARAREKCLRENHFGGRNWCSNSARVTMKRALRHQFRHRAPRKECFAARARQWS